MMELMNFTSSIDGLNLCFALYLIFLGFTIGKNNKNND